MDPISLEKKQGTGKGVIASVIAIVLILGGVLFAFKQGSFKDQDDIVSVPKDTDTNATTIDTIAVATEPKYKDGSYTAVGSYTSPAGGETVTLQVTLKDGIVIDSKVTPHATNAISVKMQTAFVSGFKQFVVGKKIAGIELSKVSGSSLTPKGFNDALAKIKVQAQVQA